ncbi:hypothetical protein [Ottowia sp. oral taxon 894]|nr:hypothetical protein [Ottowia sp. oral taxon 894]
MQMIANDSYIVFEINAYDGFTAIGGIAPFPLPSVQKKANPVAEKAVLR